MQLINQHTAFIFGGELQVLRNSGQNEHLFTPEIYLSWALVGWETKKCGFNPLLPWRILSSSEVRQPEKGTGFLRSHFFMTPSSFIKVTQQLQIKLPVRASILFQPGRRKAQLLLFIGVFKLWREQLVEPDPEGLYFEETFLFARIHVPTVDPPSSFSAVILLAMSQ